MKTALSTNRLVRYLLTSKLRAKFSMSLSLIAVGSCSSLLASAAGDSIASNPRNARAYAVFILPLKFSKLETRVATCKLVFEPKLINRCEIPRLTWLYELRFGRSLRYAVAALHVELIYPGLVALGAGYDSERGPTRFTRHYFRSHTQTL